MCQTEQSNHCIHQHPLCNKQPRTTERQQGHRKGCQGTAISSGDHHQQGQKFN